VSILTGKERSTITKMRKREAWWLIDAPGLKRFKRVSVAFLERRFDIRLTRADLERAARLHAAAVRGQANARAARRCQSAAVTLGFAQTPLEDQPKRRFSSVVLRH
jgi:hypothetical protein